MHLRKLIVFSIVFPLLSACGDGGGDPTAGDQVTTQQGLNGGNGSGGSTGVATIELSTATTIANAYCTNQRKLQLISASLLSAYSPKGNGTDTTKCGGENLYNDDGTNFSLQLNDYCIVNRGEKYTLNGSITGATESGSNFTSTIAGLSIQGKDVDLNISGDSYAGRADDNFVNLQILDNLTKAQYSIEKSSVKKGEFDFGDATFPQFASTHFQFITHFNEDNTEGLLYFYGSADDKIIISGDNGMITAIYSVDRHDSGTWLDLPCNN